MLEQATQYSENNEFLEGASMEHVLQEDMMFRRHRRLREAEELTYEFTTDPALLHQYYVLRSLIFDRALQVSLPAEADEIDQQSDILIARQGNQVVGGVRMQIIEPHSDTKTMINQYGGDAKKTLPNLDLDKKRYCELSRMVIPEEFQNSDVVSGIFSSLLERSLKEHIDYGLLIGMKSALRVHRKIFNRLGVDVSCIDKINVPDAEELVGKDFGMIVVNNLSASHYNATPKTKRVSSHRRPLSTTT